VINGGRGLLIAGPLVFLLLFFFYPVGKILFLAFSDQGQGPVAQFKAIFSDSYYLQTLWFTLWQAAVSTLLTLVTALPGAWVFARFNFRGKALLQALLNVPFVLPTVVVAAAFQSLLGPKGLVNQWAMQGLNWAHPPIDINHTAGFIILAHLFYNYSIVFRIVGSFWSHLPPRVAESAHMLGASRWRVFIDITWPLLAPAVRAAALLVFLFCFCSFGVVLILGGPRFATIEVEIYRQAVHLFNLPMAGALSVIQIGFTFVLMQRYTRMERRESVSLDMRAAGGIPLRKPSDYALLATNIGFMAMLLGAPMAALLVKSFQSADGWSLIYYRSLFTNASQSIFFVPPVQAIYHSMQFATATMLMAMVLGGLAAGFLAGGRGKYHGWLDPVFMLPLSTSAVTLGFGFIVALDRPPLNLRTSLWLIPLAHTLVALPFVIRSLTPALRAVPQNLKESAAMLGASPGRVWRTVDLPIVARAAAVGAVFAFTISLGEFGATVFVARPQTPTMPLAIYRFLSQPGALNYGQAMAMSSLLMLATAAGFVGLELLRERAMGNF